MVGGATGGSPASRYLGATDSPPQNQEVQEAYYSGKQAEHTRKNQLITLPKGTDIADVVIGEKSPRIDSKLFEQTQAELPQTIEFIEDQADVGRRHTVMF